MLPDLELFGTAYAVIFVAELPDKTALASLALATRYKALPIFFGAALALMVQSMIAVAAGGLLSLLPARLVHLGAGLLFIVSAIVMWRRKTEIRPTAAEPKETRAFFPTLASTFGVVFIAELGDLTQLGTAALAARYRSPLTIFAAATLALWSVAAIAVVIGNRAGALMKPEVTQKVASAIFALVGIALVSGIM